MSTLSPTAPTTGAAAQPGQPWRWYAVLAAGLLIGLVSFAYQTWFGLGTTALTNTVTWGAYIVLFMFLVGVSAGGLIVVAGSELVGTHRFEQLNKLAVIVSGTAVAAAAISIIPDLGRPFAAWRMLTSPNLTSPLVWDMAIITVYLTIAAIDLWILTRPNPQPRALKIMAMITLPVAVLVHSVTAWIFGLLVARPFWNTALMAPLFISSALVSGTALVLLVVYIVKRTTAWEPPSHVWNDLGRLLAWFVAVDFFLLFAEIVTVYTSQMASYLSVLEMLFTGRLAALFWFQILLGVAVPFAIYVHPRLRARLPLLVTAATLSVLGVLAKRVNILMPGMFDPLVGLEPGIPAGRPGQAFEVGAPYWPTWVEWGVMLGIVAFGAALITIGVRRYVLPETRRDPETSEA